MTQAKQIVGVYLCGKDYFKQPAHHLAVTVSGDDAHSFDSELFRQNVIQTYCRELNNRFCEDVKDPL